MLEGLFDADRWSTTFQNMGPFWEGFGVTLQVVVAGLLLALVAGGDLMYRSDNFVSLYGYLQGYIVCCLMYFIICFPLAMLVQWLERRSKERPRGVSLAELGLDNVEEA